jgi:spore germination protein GerM
MKPLMPIYRLSLLAIALSLILFSFACEGEQDDDAIQTPTASPAATAPTPSPAVTSPTPPQSVTVQLYFLDEENFSTGTQPYVTPVGREVEAPAVPLQALEELFAGPTPEERARGLRFVNSEATGFADFEVEDGIATLRLTGGCDSGGSTFTIAREIIPTLTQFPDIQYVKILDPDGSTESPEGPGDSIPACLEP